MVKNFLYDNLISFIGAWILCIFTLTLWYWISSISNVIYIKKHSILNQGDFWEPWEELKWTYWTHC